MAEPINLNKARKAKARVTAQAEAEANRVKFGRTKAEKQRQAIDRERMQAVLDGAKREG